MPPPVIITCKSGDALDRISDASIAAVVMDPPYGANVMYAELSDFFYVWLKRTAELVMPELFTRYLTDKNSEAVANKAKFKGQKSPDSLANRDYQKKMAAIFAESRRVLKPNGIMTVMFTHKDTSAWDALTKGLIEAGFIITASWPVNTEAEGSLHTWRLNQLTHTMGRGDLDATTSWFVLAWDAFKAPVFSYDEGLRLARAVGADLDGQLIGKICEKKGSDIKLWDSATRAAKERRASAGRRRSCRRSDFCGRALAPSGSGFSSPLRQLAAEASDCRRSRPW